MSIKPTRHAIAERSAVARGPRGVPAFSRMEKGMRGFRNFLLRGDVIVVAVGLVVALAFSALSPHSRPTSSNRSSRASPAARSAWASRSAAAIRRRRWISARSFPRSSTSSSSWPPCTSSSWCPRRPSRPGAGKWCSATRPRSRPARRACPATCRRPRPSASTAARSGPPSRPDVRLRPSPSAPPPRKGRAGRLRRSVHGTRQADGAGHRVGQRNRPGRPLRLAQAGYDVAINYSRSGAAARQTLAELESLGGVISRCAPTSVTTQRWPRCPAKSARRSAAWTRW